MKHKMRKILSTLLAGLIALSALGISAFAVEETDFVGYHSSRVVAVELGNIPNIKTYDLTDFDYTEQAAYKVTDVDGLIYLSTVVVSSRLENVTVYLAKDLDMTGVTSWLPIGSTTDLYFGGTFDGQGHVIDNLVVNDTRTGISGNSFTGLFGYVFGGTVKNVVVGVNCSFASEASADRHVAALVACLGNSETVAGMIDNCLAQGTVTANRFGGGIVAAVRGGNNNANVVQNCTSAVTINGSGAIGGFGGFVLSSYKIMNCRNVGNITSSSGDTNSGTGAFIGRNGWNTCQVEISNCINNGSVKAEDYVAIFIGYFQKTDSVATVSDSYNYGTLTATGTNNNYIANHASNLTQTTVENKQGSTDPTLTNMETIKPDFTPAVSVPNGGTDRPVLRAVQNTSVLNGKQGVRFLAVIDTLNYESIGFDWRIQYTKAGENEATLDASDSETATTVYESINAENVSGNIYAVTATELNGTYIYALSFQNVPTDGTVVFTITPTATATDSQAFTGVSYVITYTNGEFVSSSIVND